MITSDEQQNLMNVWQDHGPGTWVKYTSNGVVNFPVRTTSYPWIDVNGICQVVVEGFGQVLASEISF